MSPPPLVSCASRVVAHEDRLAEAAAEVFSYPAGRVILQPAFPHVFDSNVVRHPRLRLDGLDAQISRLDAAMQAIGARHLQITCDTSPLSEEVGGALRQRRFLCERLLVMTLTGPPARRASPYVEVEAVPAKSPLRDYAEAMDRMSRHEPWFSPVVSREIIGSLASKARVGALSLHVGRLDGRPVGAAGLSVDATRKIGAVTTVGTVPEARGRGVAQAMVVTLCENARAAGCDLVYLVARAADTPKEMYRKLGFEVAFGFDVWLRPPQP